MKPLDLLPVSVPFAAIFAAYEEQEPVTPKDLLRFEAAAVRALFDEGLIEQRIIRRGRAEQSVVVPSSIALSLGEEKGHGHGREKGRKGPGRRTDDFWTPEKLAYLEDAYPTGASWREMVAHLGISGGRVLIRAHEHGLARPAFRRKKKARNRSVRKSTRENNWLLTPAWRIRQLRIALKDAQARGTNSLDDGEDLFHRALKRRFKQGRGGPQKALFEFWSKEEEALLRTHYPSGGGRACLPFLPGRSLAAIYNHAALLKLKCPRSLGKRKYAATVEVDAAIRRVYKRKIAKGEIKALSERLGYPDWWVKKRAVFLGLVLPRTKELDWTTAELSIIADHAHEHLNTIRRHLKKAGFVRTETAIKLQIRRRGFETADPDHVTATSLARICGIDAKVVTLWIEKQWIPAARRGTKRTARQGGDQWWIHKRNFRDFVFANPNLVDFRKVDQVPFLDLLAGRTPARIERKKEKDGAPLIDRMAAE